MMNLSFPSQYQNFSQAVSQKPIEFRQIFFEHFLYPATSKLTLISIQTVINALKPFALNEKVAVEAFISVVSKNFPSIPEQDAKSLFVMHQLATQLDSNPQIDILQPADIRSLCLYLFVQMFQQHSRQTNSLENKVKDFNVQQDNRQLYQDVFKPSAFLSPINSPRAKTMRVQNQSSESQQILHFLKTQIKALMKYVGLNFEENDENFINDKSFNVLSLILQGEQQPLSSVMFEKTNKIPILNAVDWMQKNIGYDENEIYQLSGFTKSVTIKPYNSMPITNMRIHQCEDSHIFIDNPLTTLSIQQCTNCVIFVSAVKFVTTISSCDRVTVCLASTVLRISNTIDSTFHYFGVHPPILYGDSRNITLGPHNGNTLKLLERLRESGIPITKRNAELFKKPLLLQGIQNNHFTIINPEELSVMPLAEETFGALNYQLIDECQFDVDRLGKELTEKKVLTQPLNLDRIFIPPLAPTEYQKTIFARYKYFSDLQIKIKLAGIKDDDSKLLQQAIQGNFREWLVSTGSIKPITDLVKLIDDQN